MQVDFDDFKDSFVRILCQTNMDEPLSEEEEDSNEEESGAESDNEDEGEGGETEGGKNEESTDAGVYTENTRWESFDIKFTRQGFENAC